MENFIRNLYAPKKGYSTDQMIKELDAKIKLLEWKNLYGTISLHSDSMASSSMITNLAEVEYKINN